MGSVAKANRGKVWKAVIPAGGLGTRLLPLTKAIPKEMIPLGGKPLIQYAVEEAAASGIRDVILVVNKSKPQIRQHFAEDPELERLLTNGGRVAAARRIKELSSMAQISIALQDRPGGLAHAIQCTRAYVGGDAFAVILPDAVIDASIPCVRQLLGYYEQRPACYIATREVDPGAVDRFGILAVEPVPKSSSDHGAIRVKGLVEKPPLELAPSRFGVFGRYVLTAEIFDFIERTPPDRSGEVQITDSLALYCDQHPLYGVVFQGRHYDAGDRLDYLRAVIDFALKEPELVEPLRAHLRSLNLN